MTDPGEPTIDEVVKVYEAAINRAARAEEEAELARGSWAEFRRSLEALKRVREGAQP